MTNCLCAHLSVILRCCTTQEINTKIILLGVHKQFATQEHTLFYIYLTRQKNNKWLHICVFVDEEIIKNIDFSETNVQEINGTPQQ